MLKYETVFVNDPTLTEEENEEIIRMLDDVVTSGGGTVHKVERWGKRRLAYPILHMEEGTYVLMLIECPASLVKEIDRRYRMNDRILRHQTVRVQDESQLEPSPIMRSRASEREERAAETDSARPPHALSSSEGEMDHA
ncbi:MAG TPA: 30S ribosomal protein S6 [Candidatus Polarisedimenticolia bacterium]|nr:30S ribosomal protein S6 [Candidatus Polarisedimenticolia bacterium]